MLQFSNSSRVMETETISKNEWSLKKQMIRRSYFQEKIMRETNRTMIILLLMLIFSNCSAYKSVHTSNVGIGMSKSEVVEKIGKKPKLIGQKQYKEGLFEVIEFRCYDFWHGVLEDAYWFYFLNNKLLFWGQPSSNWQKEADSYIGGIQ